MGLSNMTVTHSPIFQVEGTLKGLVTMLLRLLEVCRNALYELPAEVGMRRNPCTYTGLSLKRSASDGNLLKRVMSWGTGYPPKDTFILA